MLCMRQLDLSTRLSGRKWIKALAILFDNLSNSCLVCPFVVEEEEQSMWERHGEKVSLDQLHSKSVYSAQFGIKHNRLLSACYCLWCPIKMEFIAALRASPNYTFSCSAPSSSLSLSLICTSSFFSDCGDVSVFGFFSHSSSSSVAVRHVAHYRAGTAGMPTYLSPITVISSVTCEWRSNITLMRAQLLVNVVASHATSTSHRQNHF